MGKINILPKHLAELIAAGEVVERPASAVKEMLENAIDAGADKITVEIKNGGIRYIRITDNGCGIGREDVRAAFISHATSKIETKEDLDAIFTLGFRGEALASVAAVSKTELLTRRADEEIGTRYAVTGGEEQLLEDAGCPVGTTIVVRDLFFNTPARMKFLKKDITEGNYVSDVVSKIALSHPEISIALIKDNKRTLFTPGDGRLMTVINEVFGKEFASGLIEVKGDSTSVKVNGFISRPVAARPNRSMQHCFVNGRYVKLPSASAALDNAYKNQIMAGKHPACVLFLTVNPKTVDVNVHPAKTQVRFSDERAVYDGVYFSALSALSQKDDVVRVRLTEKEDTRQLFTPKARVDQLEIPPEAPKAAVRIDFTPEELHPDTEAAKAPEEPLPRGAAPYVPSQRLFVRDVPLSPFNTSADEADVLNMRGDAKPEKKEETPQVPPKSIDEAATAPSEPTATEPFRVVGEVFNTYILIEKSNKLIFIDKHAAHERIIYNELRRGEKKAFAQLLLAPVTVTLSRSEYAAVVGNLDIFTQSGYGVEDFGQGTVIVREAPCALSDEDVSEILLEMADKLMKNSLRPEPEKLDWLYHSTACRSAIKAGDHISVKEMEDLAMRVFGDREVRYCPHGRPVMFEISEYEVKKLFGRIG